jgi:aryl-alcohol dehydrogenase-like predicted oxidoreductase
MTHFSGAMTFGTFSTAQLGECSKETARAIFDEFVKAGGNFIDTASNYQNGQSEEWLGEFIAESKIVKRADVVLATKFSGPMLGGEICPNSVGNGRKNLVESLERSLTRLRMTYVDLLYVHIFDGGSMAPLDLMMQLDYVVRSGKVLHVAISDAPAWYVAICQTLANERSLTPFVAYQGKYSAIDRDCESELLPLCTHQNIAYVPWAVLGRGKLASETLEGATRAGALTDAEKAVHAAVVAVAKKIGHSPAAVATSWCAARVPSVLVGVRKVSQLKDAIDGVSFRLSPEDDAKITDAFAFKLPFPQQFSGVGIDAHHFEQVSFTRSSGRIATKFEAPIAQPVAQK